MKIVTLVENKKENRKLKSVHGLSLYIEVGDTKILFDIGPNNYYLKNAEKLGIDISDVDYLFVSHGHIDHARGLNKFLKVNEKAEVVISPNAFDDHTKKLLKGTQFNIGIKKPKDTNRFIFIDKNTFILDDLFVVCDMPFVDQVIQDESLMTYRDGQYIKDDFKHEIYLVITEGVNSVLISGCSHKGLENIIDTIEKKHKIKLTHVIGGYHFSHYDNMNFRETDYLAKLGKKLYKRGNTKFYSCHCTGEDAYDELRIHLKEKITEINTGTIIEI